MSDGLKVLLGALGGALLVLLLVGGFSGGGMGYGMMGGMGHMMSGSMMGGGMIGALFMLLFWGLLIALIVVVVVFIVGQSQRRYPSKQAAQSLASSSVSAGIRPHTTTSACGLRGARRCRPYSAPSARPRNPRSERALAADVAGGRVRTSTRAVPAPAARPTTPWKKP
jgi:hypothetical protein